MAPASEPICLKAFGLKMDMTRAEVMEKLTSEHLVTEEFFHQLTDEFFHSMPLGYRLEFVEEVLYNFVEQQEAGAHHLFLCLKLWTGFVSEEGLAFWTNAAVKELVFCEKGAPNESPSESPMGNS